MLVGIDPATVHRRKAMLHHYEKFIGEAGGDTKEYMEGAAENRK